MTQTLPCSIQAVIQVVNFLMLFLMLVATYLFQVGLVALLAKDFKPFAFISLVYFASLLAYGGVKMVRAWLRMYRVCWSAVLVIFSNNFVGT